jgi:hypothetical protein
VVITDGQPDDLGDESRHVHPATLLEMPLPHVPIHQRHQEQSAPNAATAAIRCGRIGSAQTHPPGPPPAGQAQREQVVRPAQADPVRPFQPPADQQHHAVDPGHGQASSIFLEVSLRSPMVSRVGRRRASTTRNFLAGYLLAAGARAHFRGGRAGLAVGYPGRCSPARSFQGTKAAVRARCVGRWIRRLTAGSPPFPPAEGAATIKVLGGRRRGPERGR